MNKQLQRLIDLSNKTGDRLVVFDPRNESSAYVIMPIDDYENLAVGRHEVRGLTEDELLDKINRDIAIWKSDRIDEKMEEEENENIIFKDNIEDPSEDDFAGEDDWYSINEVAEKKGFKLGDEEIEIKGEKKVSKGGPWQIPSERKQRAEEIIEEDRVYLEDIED